MPRQMALHFNPLPQAKATAKKPARDIYGNQRRIDREALAMMAETGCTFSEAWLKILDREGVTSA